MSLLTKTTCFLALACLLSACGGSSEISEQIEERLAVDETRLDLSSIGPKGWERVCVLGPYTNNESAEEILGFEWDAEAHTAIHLHDHIGVLVFIREHEVLAYEEVLRSTADFIDVRPRCVPRADAVFVRQPQGAEWPSFTARSQ